MCEPSLVSDKRRALSYFCHMLGTGPCGRNASMIADIIMDGNDERWVPSLLEYLNFIYNLKKKLKHLT